MKRYYLLTLFFGLFFNIFSGFAQTPAKLVSGDFKSSGIEQFVLALESETGYRFYYDPVQFDSLYVTLKADKKLLAEVLDKAFENTDFRYSIDSGRKAVFLTKKYIIHTFLPDGLVEKNNVAVASAAIPELKTTDFSDRPANEVPKATMENKLYVIGTKAAGTKSGSASLSGHILDAATGAPLPGVAIFVENPRIGASTDQFGYYLLNLPKGTHTLNITGVGLKSAKRHIALYSDGELNIELQEQVNTLKVVVFIYLVS